jgi:hypothetical protein
MDFNKIKEAIAKRQEMQEPNPKSKKVKGTGLSVYEGGNEKTPTGRSNAFTESGLTEETLLDYANRYKFPTTSNKDFQEAQIAYLESTPEGKKVIKDMMDKYGMPKAGTLADGMLGARTFEIMKAVENITPKEQPKEKPKVEPADEYFLDSRQTDFPSYMVPGLNYTTNANNFAGLINTRTGKVSPVRKEDYDKFAMSGVARRYLEERIKSNPEEFDLDTFPDQRGYIYRKKTGEKTGNSKIKMDMSTGEVKVIKNNK